MSTERTTFLEAAGSVSDLVRPVGTAWDEPSVLTGRTIGGLAGHLSRAVTTVGTNYSSGDATTADGERLDAAAYLLAGPFDGHLVVRSMVGGHETFSTEPS